MRLSVVIRCSRATLCCLLLAGVCGCGKDTEEPKKDDRAAVDHLKRGQDSGATTEEPKQGTWPKDDVPPNPNRDNATPPKDDVPPKSKVAANPNRDNATASKDDVPPKNDVPPKRILPDPKILAQPKDDKARPPRKDVPAKLLVPDPKVAAELKAQAEKQRILLDLCALALQKETRGKAIAQLEASYAELARPIGDLAVDEDPERIRLACKAIGAMGGKARGAWPAVLTGTTRMLKSDKSGAGAAAVAGIEALSSIAPDESVLLDLLLAVSSLPSTDKTSALRTAAIVALGKCAPHNPREQAKIVRGLDDALRDLAGAETAIKTLADVARTCPTTRPQITKVLDEAIKKKLFAKHEALRRAAAEALAPCSVAAEAARDTLDDLKVNDTAGPVRDAAAATLKELARQKAVVPHLNAAGIVEGEIATTLYQLAFALAEGRKTLDGAKVDYPKKEPEKVKDPEAKQPADTRDEVWKALAAAPRDADLWVTLTGLARLPKHLTARQTALAILNDWATEDKELRKPLLPVFSAGLSDNQTQDLAVDGLIRCGGDGVQVLVSTKQKFDVIAALRRAMSAEDSKIRVAAAEGLGKLRPTTSRGVEPLLDLLDPKQPPEVAHAAAQALQHLGPDQWEFAERLHAAHAQSENRKTIDLIGQTLKNMGFEPGSGFAGSVVTHPKVGMNTRKRILETLNLPVLEGKGAEGYVAAWVEHTNPKLNKVTTPTMSNYSNEALAICKMFGAKAKQLAPLLADDLMAYTKGNRCAFYPVQAAEALGYIGEVPGVEVRKVLERAGNSLVNPGSLRPAEETAVNTAALAALRKLK